MLFLVQMVEDTPPDTLDFMILGFGVIFFVMGIYIFSLFNRSRKLKRDLKSLEELE